MSSGGYEYRVLVPLDSKKYREIRLESLRAHPKSFGSSFAEQRKLPKLMFEKAIEQPTDSRFVVGVFDQKELIGICGFIPLGPDNIYDQSNAGALIQMYVRQTYRGRKIGSTLIKTTIRNAFRISNIEQVVLEVKEENRKAVRVYEQAGFQKFNIDGNNIDFITDGTRVMIIHRDD